MKLYKIESRNETNGQYEDQIIEISENDISDITNSYGLWIESSNHELDDSDFEHNEDGTYDLTEHYTESENLDLVPGSWDLRALDLNQRDVLIELSKYSIDNSDDANSTSCFSLEIDLHEQEEIFDYYLKIESVEPIVIGKEYKYWDGNNWKSMVLEHDHYDVEMEEVTSDYEDWEAKTSIYCSEDKHGRSFSLYVMKLNEINVLVKKEETRWQNEFDTFMVITHSDDITVLLAKYVDDDKILEYFPEVEKEHGEDLRVTECGFIFSKNDLEFIDSSDSNDSTGTKIYLHKKSGKNIKLYWSNWQGSKDSWELF